MKNLFERYQLQIFAIMFFVVGPGLIILGLCR
jgi:hypothetical protein